MSQFDIQSLENNFHKWRQDCAPEENESDAFEVYSIEQILKHDDLTDDEIESGRLGGGGDGGVDAMYLFINRQLIQEESAVPELAITVDLVIIQAKYSKSFTETGPAHPGRRVPRPQTAGGPGQAARMFGHLCARDGRTPGKGVLLG
jgi:hypothetical protein